RFLRSRCFCSSTPPPPRSTRFPYTTLFRSAAPGRLGRQPDQAWQSGPLGGRGRPPGWCADKSRQVPDAGSGPRRVCSPNLDPPRSEEHTSELQSRENLVCRLLLEKKKKDST